MNKIALSTEEMIRLMTYGINTNIASMKWMKMPTADAIIHDTDEYTWELFISRTKMIDSIPAFTLNDIIDLLPKNIYINSIKYRLDMFIDEAKNEWNISYSRCDCSSGQKMEYILIESNPDIITAAYNMLCKLIEKGFIN